MPLTWNGVAAINRTWFGGAYSPTLARWLVLTGANNFTSARAKGMISDDGGVTWSDVAAGADLWIDNLDGDGYPGTVCNWKTLHWDTVTSQYLGIGSELVPSTADVNLFLYRSADGLTWHRNLIHLEAGTGGLIAQGAFVVNGPLYAYTTWTSTQGTLVFTSSDLTTWTRTTVPANLNPGAAIYAGGQYVCVGLTVNNLGVPTPGVPIITSPDGLTWTGQMGFVVGFVSKSWVGLAATPAGYAAVAGNVNGTGAAMTSGDGATWTLADMPALSSLSGTYKGWTDLTYASGVGLVTVNGNNPGKASEGSAVSTDNGATWSLLATPLQNPPGDATTNTVFLGVGTGGSKIVAFSRTATLYHILTQTLTSAVWYYNPSTNHYEYITDGSVPPSPWVVASPSPTPALTCSSGVIPNVGSTAGGTLVRVVGTGFGDGIAITLGGVTLTSISVTDQTTITGLSPAHAAGAVDLVITNADGVSVTCTGGFLYVDATLVGGPEPPGWPTSNPGTSSGGSGCVDTFSIGSSSGGSGCVL